MTYVNTVFRVLVDGLLYPFRTLHPLVGLTLVAFLAAIFILVVYKKTSNQKGIEAAKEKIWAGIFEVRLFNDDLRAILRAQGGILRHNLSYLGLSFVPLLWMIVPFLLLFAQLQFHYGYSGLEPGQTTILKVALQSSGDGGETDRPNIALELPEGIVAETPAVWIPAVNEMDWRLRVEEAGEHEITLRAADGQAYTKSVVSSDRTERRSLIRPGGSFIDLLLYPAEEALPKSAPIKSISIDYPPSGLGEVGWMIWFFGISVVFALLLKKRFGVTF